MRVFGVWIIVGKGQRAALLSAADERHDVGATPAVKPDEPREGAASPGDGVLLSELGRDLLLQGGLLLGVSLVIAGGVLVLLYLFTTPAWAGGKPGANPVADLWPWLVGLPELGVAPGVDWTAVAIVLVIAPLTLVLAVTLGPRTAYSPGSQTLLPVEVIARSLVIERVTFWVACLGSTGLWIMVAHIPREPENVTVMIALSCAAVLDAMLAALSGPSYEQRLQDKVDLRRDLTLLSSAPVPEAPWRAWRGVGATSVGAGAAVALLVGIHHAVEGASQRPLIAAVFLGSVVMLGSLAWALQSLTGRVSRWIRANRRLDKPPSEPQLLAHLRRERLDATSMLFGLVMLGMLFIVVAGVLGSVLFAAAAVAAVPLIWHFSRKWGALDRTLLREAALYRDRTSAALERLERTLQLVDPHA